MGGTFYIKYVWSYHTYICSVNIVSLTSIPLQLFNRGAAYIRVFIFYWHIKYHILNMLKINCDVNQQDLKKVDLHFCKSE